MDLSGRKEDIPHRIFVQNVGQNIPKKKQLILKKSNFIRYEEIYNFIVVTLHSKFDESPELNMNLKMHKNSFIKYIVYNDSITNYPLLEFLVSFNKKNYQKTFHSEEISEKRKSARRNWMESISRELSFGCHIFPFNPIDNPMLINDPEKVRQNHKYMFFFGVDENYNYDYSDYSNFVLYNDEVVEIKNDKPFQKTDTDIFSDIMFNNGEHEHNDSHEEKIFFLVRYHVITGHPIEQEYAPWLKSNSEDIAYILCKEFNIPFVPIETYDDGDIGNDNDLEKMVECDNSADEDNEESIDREDSMDDHSEEENEKLIKKKVKVDNKKTNILENKTKKTKVPNNSDKKRKLNANTKTIRKNKKQKMNSNDGNKIEKAFLFFFNYFYEIIKGNLNSQSSTFNLKTYKELQENLNIIETVVDDYIIFNFEYYLTNLSLSSSSFSSSNSLKSKNVNDTNTKNSPIITSTYEKKQEIETMWWNVFSALPKNPKFFHSDKCKLKLSKIISIVRMEKSRTIQWKMGSYKKENNTIVTLDKKESYSLNNNQSCLLTNRNFEDSDIIPFIEMPNAKEIFCLKNLQKKQLLYDNFFKSSDIFYSIQDYVFNEKDEVGHNHINNNNDDNEHQGIKSEIEIDRESMEEENVLNKIINTFLHNNMSKDNVNSFEKKDEYTLSKICSLIVEKEHNQKSEIYGKTHFSSSSSVEELFYLLFKSTNIENPKIAELIKINSFITKNKKDNDKAPPPSIERNLFNLKKMNIVFTALILMNIKIIACFCFNLLKHINS